MLNPQAKFNDGTPVDVKALQTTWKTQQKADGEYNIVSSDIYGYVESVEAEEDNFHVKVTFSKPFYPLNALFTFILHPALEDPKVFNEGFVDNLHPEWGCGPFTIKDGGFNSSEKTITVVPNDNGGAISPCWRRLSSGRWMNQRRKRPSRMTKSMLRLQEPPLPTPSLRRWQARNSTRECACMFPVSM